MTLEQFMFFEEKSWWIIAFCVANILLVITTLTILILSHRKKMTLLGNFERIQTNEREALHEIRNVLVKFQSYVDWVKLKEQRVAENTDKIVEAAEKTATAAHKISTSPTGDHYG